MTHSGTSVPIQSIIVERTFISIAEAARFYDLPPSTVRRSVEQGSSCRERWFRFADMPANCQPLKRSHGAPIISDAGLRHSSIGSCVRSFFIDAVPSYRKYRTEWKALKTAILAGGKWHGNHYRFVTAEDLVPCAGRLVLEEITKKAKE